MKYLNGMYQIHRETPVNLFGSSHVIKTKGNVLSLAIVRLDLDTPASFHFDIDNILYNHRLVQYLKTNPGQH